MTSAPHPTLPKLERLVADLPTREAAEKELAGRK